MIRFHVEEAERDVEAGRIKTSTFRKWKDTLIAKLIEENFEVLVSQGTVAGLPRSMLVGGETPGVKERVYQLANEAGMGGYVGNGQWYIRYVSQNKTSKAPRR